MPEITEAHLNHLLGRAQIADFVESIYNDPVLSKEAKALIKKKYPQAQIPDYDIEAKFENRLEQERKAREEEKAAAKRAEEDRLFQEKRAQVQKEYGYTEDGMKDLEKLMAERNIGDYEAAATYHASKNPKQIDADHSDGLWHHGNNEHFKEIAKDPEGWARKEFIAAARRDQERERQQRF